MFVYIEEVTVNMKVDFVMSCISNIALYLKDKLDFFY